MAGAPCRRLVASAPVEAALGAIGDLIATLETADMPFTRLGSGCVVVTLQGGALHFIPNRQGLSVELRHPDDAARLQPKAKDLLTQALPGLGALRWS